MAFGSRGPSKSFIVFCLLFGAALGFLTTGIALGLVRVAVGEEAPRGVFLLLWMMSGGIFFAWPMHVVERLRAVRRQREVIRERIGDLDYEPPTLPFLGTRAQGPKADAIEIKAPDIGDGKFRRFLARGRTAEQRMADHLKTLELKAEMKRATGSKAQEDPSSDPGD